MAGRTVLIDGYNVIRADPGLRNIERGSMEDGRTALMNKVAGSPRFQGDSVFVVFDGPQIRSYNVRERIGMVSAVYASTGQTADDVIKAKAAASRQPRVVVVVTNDADIRTYCEGLGCTVTTSENFVAQLAIPRKLRPIRDTEPDEDYSRPIGAPKKGNPKRLSKKERNKRDYRF